MHALIGEVAQYIQEKGQARVHACVVERDHICVTIDSSDVLSFFTFLRRDPHCEFVVLIDICGVDYPMRSKRFEVVYHLLSVKHNHRIRVKVPICIDEAIPSITEIYPGASWFEREAYDLYGISFLGHPDLRRILTDYGFEGHPLRKDFPLTGFVEVRYSDEERSVVYNPVVLQQEFRNFDFVSPWATMNDLHAKEEAEEIKTDKTNE